MVVRGQIPSVDVAAQAAVNDRTDHPPRVRYADRLAGRDWLNDRLRVGARDGRSIGRPNR